MTPLAKTAKSYIIVVVNVEFSYAFQYYLPIAILSRKSDINSNKSNLVSTGYRVQVLIYEKTFFSFFLHFVFTVFIFLQVSFSENLKMVYMAFLMSLWMKFMSET